MSRKKLEEQEEILTTEPEQESGPVIYCGPDVLKYGLKKFRIYADDLPLNVKDAIKEIPEVEKLIVPYKNLEDMRAKISKRGTPEFEYNLRVENLNVRPVKKLYAHDDRLLKIM